MCLLYGFRLRSIVRRLIKSTRTTEHFSEFFLHIRPVEQCRMSAFVEGREQINVAVFAKVLPEN